ncbi:hypothetical protein [Nakamurella deserti]|uniref:hypothetical protein n=1 Tax=Nakamurella deserti TaxID=2164074 RepID=UPI000DBE9D38|nr:hypothetical protein [Nakamurella deserti]
MKHRPPPVEVDSTPDDLCRDLVATLGLDGAAVTARGSLDHGHLVFATDDVARAIDEWHLTLNEGPSIDAFLHRSPYAVPDLTAGVAGDRWPVLTREVGSLGVAALFAFLLQVGTVPFGTVQLYRRTPGALSPVATTTALLGTGHIARAVLRELHSTRGRTLGHDEIAIATGMIAVQAEVPVTNALALLRAAAFAERTSIHEIADAVVRRTRRFG